MNFFNIKSEQIKRLKAFEQMSKKLNALKPLDPKCLFIVNKDKLSVYGYGGGAFGHGAYTSTFDIESEAEFSFLCQVSNFINFLEKTKSDSVNVSYDENVSRITFKGTQSKSLFSSIVLAVTPKEKEEISMFLTSFKEGPTYQNSINISLTSELKEAISNFSSITGLLKTNDSIVIEKNIIKSIDNVSIIKEKFEEDIAPKAIYLNKLCAPILEKLQEFKYCEFNEFSAIYGNILDMDFEFFITQPEVEYQNVTDDEVASIIPTDESKTIVKIKSEDLLNALDEFENIFGAGSWIYKQIHFKFDEEQKSIELEYNDMANQCTTNIPYEIEESVNDTNENRMILIPTIHIKYLKSLMSINDEIKLTLNFNDIDDMNSKAIILENDKVTILLMKMSE